MTYFVLRAFEAQANLMVCVSGMKTSLQPSDGVQPTSQSFVLNAMIASAAMPLLAICIGIATEAHQSVSSVENLLLALFYAVAITLPITAPIAMIVLVIVFLVSLGLAKLWRRPWVAYPVALVALPLGYWVFVLVGGIRSY